MPLSSPRTAAALVVAAAALLAPAADAATTRAKVIRVLDGESVRVSTGGTARTVQLLGIDSPVGRECFAAEAKTALRRMLPRGVAVRLSTDARRRGVYLQRAGRLANASMLAGGFATAHRVDRLRNGARLNAAQARAKAAGRGHWSACAKPPANAPAAAAPAPPTAPAAGPDAAARDQLTQALSGRIMRHFENSTGGCDAGCFSTEEALEFCSDSTFAHDFKSVISVVLPDPIDPVTRRDEGTWRVRDATIEPEGTLSGTIEATLQRGSAINSGNATPDTIQIRTARIFTDGITLINGERWFAQASPRCA